MITRKEVDPCKCCGSPANISSWIAGDAFKTQIQCKHCYLNMTDQTTFSGMADLLGNLSEFEDRVIVRWNRTPCETFKPYKWALVLEELDINPCEHCASMVKSKSPCDYSLEECVPSDPQKSKFYPHNMEIAQ